MNNDEGVAQAMSESALRERLNVLDARMREIEEAQRQHNANLARLAEQVLQTIAQLRGAS